ncbi:MAG: DUF4097 family beta strand repeat-containing protein [Candidatus Acidiferrales bacterium]
MRVMRFVTMVALGTLTAAAWTATCRANDEVFDRVVPLPAANSFELQNVNGSVDVEGWDRNDVEIHAVKTTKSGKADLDRVRIEVQSAAGRVSVQTVYPKDDSVEVAIAYTIHVPQRVLLRQVTTVNGDIRVHGVDATGTLRSVNGDVEAYDSTGSLSAQTTNGNIRLELCSLTDSPLNAQTVNGSIIVALPPGSGASLDARSLNGEVKSDLPFAGDSSGRREFHGLLGAGGTSMRLRTVNGSIHIMAFNENSQ